jgi:hypothetical protein
MSRRWLEVARPDLDILTACARQEPGRALYVNSNDERLSVPEMAPIRAFMAEFDIWHAMGIALETSWGCDTPLFLTRGACQPPFRAQDARALTAFGP